MVKLPEGEKALCLHLFSGSHISIAPVVDDCSLGRALGDLIQIKEVA